jgi:DNA-binding GntR family transcriptional regulator
MRVNRRIDGPRTLADQAELAIQDAILEGELAPGTRLTIDELARAIDISPMPVRDALRKLAQTGFIEYVPHRGATVALLSVEDLRDTWDARIALESLAIRRAAERFGDDDRAFVEGAIVRHTDGLNRRDQGATQEAHRDVHMGLYGPSGYNWLERLVQPVWIRSERYRSFALGDRGTPEQLAAEHRSILLACVEHDPGRAAGELYTHLVRTANIVAEKLAGAPLFALMPPSSVGEATWPAIADPT